MFLSANNVIDLFTRIIGAAVDEKSKFIIFGWPWEDSEYLSRLTIGVKLSRA